MNRTKAAIVDAFTELLEERPLNKITVKDIVDRCGINRNTFYYHFEDIPSLLRLTIEDMIHHVIQAHAAFGSPIDCLAPMVRYAAGHKNAILHIYRSTHREAFQRGLDRIADYSVTQYVKAVLADWDTLPEQSENVSLLIRYYKCTFVGAVLDWLDSGMKYDLLKAVESICELLSGSGKQAFLKCMAPQSAPIDPMIRSAPQLSAGA